MKKLLIYFAAMPIMVMGICLGACNNKAHSNRDVDDEEEEVENVVSDEDEADGLDDNADAGYIPTTDMMTFDVHGPVKSIAYQGSQQVTVYFDEDGAVSRITQINLVDSVVELADLSRDDKGRIVQIAWESDTPWVTVLSYQDDSSLPNNYASTNLMGNYISYTYSCNESGDIVSAEFEEAVHGMPVQQYTCDVEYLNRDRHGNWLRCVLENSDGGDEINRTVTYYPE